ncbi:MAG: winged helix-turn-helix transcriptional regulator [Chloroflexi bacterium]|nr:winged helix-turn-helix transcriptional regulator [Chloroflexota bacterium]
MASTIFSRSLLRNWRHSDAPFRLHDLTIYPGTRVVNVEGRDVRLTRTEFNLLLFLASRAGQVCPREELMREAWDYAEPGDCATVTVYVRRLRKKMEMYPEEPKRIMTVWGKGYMFEAGLELEKGLESLSTFQ